MPLGPFEVAVAGITGFTLMAIFAGGKKGGLRASDAVRLRRIEAKLDALLRHHELESPGDPGLDAEVRRLLDNGQKIAAIKRYRERTGAGLAEAKAAVEGFDIARM